MPYFISNVEHLRVILVYLLKDRYIQNAICVFIAEINHIWTDIKDFPVVFLITPLFLRLKFVHTYLLSDARSISEEKFSVSADISGH